MRRDVPGPASLWKAFPIDAGSGTPRRRRARCCSGCAGASTRSVAIRLYASPECSASQRATRQVRDAGAQPRRDEAARDEERRDDEPHRPGSRSRRAPAPIVSVRVSTPTVIASSEIALGGERAEHEPDDCRDEDREQPPRLRLDARGGGGEPDGRADQEDEAELTQLLCVRAPRAGSTGVVVRGAACGTSATSARPGGARWWRGALSSRSCSKIGMVVA